MKLTDKQAKYVKNHAEVLLEIAKRKDTDIPNCYYNNQKAKVPILTSDGNELIHSSDSLRQLIKEEPWESLPEGMEHVIFRPKDYEKFRRIVIDFISRDRKEVILSSGYICDMEKLFNSLQWFSQEDNKWYKCKHEYIYT